MWSFLVAATIVAASVMGPRWQWQRHQKLIKRLTQTRTGRLWASFSLHLSSLLSLLRSSLTNSRDLNESSEVEIAKANSSKTKQDGAISSFQLEAKKKAKADFLERAGNDYGYANSKKGFIDDWRPKEFPSLIPPLCSPSHPPTSINDEPKYEKRAYDALTSENDDELQSKEPEVYLDYAGSALPTKTQLLRIVNQTHQILANPHSQGGGLASDRTLKFVEVAKNCVMRHFGLDEIGFLEHSGSSDSGGLHDNRTVAEEDEKELPISSPGYKLVFTSGATESLRLVAERFPWNCLKIKSTNKESYLFEKMLNPNIKVYDAKIASQNFNVNDKYLPIRSKSVNTSVKPRSSTIMQQELQFRSLLVYPMNVHTSVIGMRNAVMERGGRFKCVSIKGLMEASPEWFQSLIVEDSFCESLKKKVEERNFGSVIREQYIASNGIESDTGNTERQDNTSSKSTSITTLWVHHMLVLPLECNFGGDHFDWNDTIAAARAADFSSSIYEVSVDKFDVQSKRNNGNNAIFSTGKEILRICNKWHILLDTAKAAATSPVFLPRAGAPDYAVVSFYKMFGAPTGLGALFIKKNPYTQKDSGCKSIGSKKCYCNDGIILEKSYQSQHYFGGGSVDVVLPRKDFTVPRNSRSRFSGGMLSQHDNFEQTPFVDLGVLVHGTEHFRGISELIHGFQELDDLGGMTSIFSHSNCLAAEFVRRLNQLVHRNGAPVVRIYGAWECFLDYNKEKGEAKTMHHSRGPTVAFNLCDREGELIGYDEVSRLAALNRPPIQLRTGCFCNPGACQDFLSLSDDDIVSNFESGHVCGDRRGVVNGKPTGAIRASFGKDSLWEDMDALSSFIEKVFVSRKSPLESKHYEPASESFRLENIFVFPIKSCAAMKVQKWPINRRTGRLIFDREFALVDSSGGAMRLHSYPKMSQIHSSINLDSNTLTVSTQCHPDLVLCLQHSKPSDFACEMASRDIQVCGISCKGNVWGGKKASDWFSSVIGIRCWLVRKDSSDPNGGDATKSTTSYSNEAPLLLVSQHSVSLLNSVISSQGWGRPVESRHFRPNIVVSSCCCNNQSEPGLVDGCCKDVAGRCERHFSLSQNPEDYWHKIIISGASNKLELIAAGKCARCQMVDVDPSSGMKGNTLRALAQFRRERGKINFGTFFSGDNNCDGEEEVVWLEEGDEVRPILK